MAKNQNIAAWLPGVGKKVEVSPSATPEPGQGELLIEVQTVAAQPADYKVQEGILPFPLTYPAILGVSFTGTIVKIGEGVTRFKQGDRVLTNGGATVRNDSRFGAYQRYALTTQDLTSKIGDVSFENAVSLSVIYGSASALMLHLHLDRPSANPNPENKAKKVLIWGASSSFGAYATQLAAKAGHSVIGVASTHNANLVTSFGASHFVDRKSQSATQDLVKLGPFEAVLAANDSAPDQVVIGNVLAAQGGGSFLSTMGVRAGVELPKGVSGFFAQFLDDYLEPKNEEFTRWLWWDYLEKVLAEGELKHIPVKVLGGLDKVQEAWTMMKEGNVSAQRLAIAPALG